jgi:biotin operon repressor
MKTALTFEEMRLWRSSLEKITLEKYTERVLAEAEKAAVIAEAEKAAVMAEAEASKLYKREEAILTYLQDKKGETVSAKELAKLLNMPTNNVYKYIKGLREKLGSNILINATGGGYIFN